MGNYYDRIIQNEESYVDTIISAISFYETELEDAKKETKIIGKLEKNSANLPYIVSHRFNQLQDIEAILKYVNLVYDREKYKEFKKYTSGNRAMSTRDAEKFAEGASQLYDIALIINQVSLIRNQFLGITKGLECKNWQISSLIKLKTAGFEDHEIEY